MSLLSESVRANCSVTLSVSVDEGETDIERERAAADRGREPLPEEWTRKTDFGREIVAEEPLERVRTKVPRGLDEECRAALERLRKGPTLF